MKASYFSFWKILVQKIKGWKIEIHFIFKNLTVSHFQIFSCKKVQIKKKTEMKALYLKKAEAEKSKSISFLKIWLFLDIPNLLCNAYFLNRLQLTKKDKLSITKKVRNIPFALASFFVVGVRLLKTSSPNHYLEEYLKNHYLKINQQFNNYLWWKHLPLILLRTSALKNTNWYHQS